MPERPPACLEWQDDLAGWLVAQLPPEREALLRGHLETCSACRAEADSLFAVAAVLLAGDPDVVERDMRLDDGAEPPADLGDRIVVAISAERRSRRRVQRAGYAGLVGVAAAIVAVFALSTDRDPAPVRGDTVAFTVMPTGASADAVVGTDKDGTIVELSASGLDPSLTYALWLSPPDGTWDDRVPAGTFRPDDDGTVDVRLRSAMPVDEYGRVWATTPDGEIALDTT
jgi:hypothetical protein